MSDAAFYTALSAQIGSLKAYPVLAPKDAAIPLVVYHRVATSRDRDIAGETGRSEVSYRVDVYHKQVLAAESIAKDIASGLLTYSNDPIRYIAIENEQNASDISGDPTIYRWMLDVRVVFA